MREARAFRLRQLGADGIRLVLRLRQPGRGEVLVRTPGSGLRRGTETLVGVVEHGFRERRGRVVFCPYPYRIAYVVSAHAVVVSDEVLPVRAVLPGAVEAGLAITPHKPRLARVGYEGTLS